jgi:hypothetical protein
MLELLRAVCNDNRTCPNIHRDTERGVWVVQGFATANANTVLVPESMVTEWVRFLPIELTGDGQALVTGKPVTDTATLVELNLPTGELAVEISLSELPALDRVGV